MTRDEAVKFLRTVKLYESRVRIVDVTGSTFEGVANQIGNGPCGSGPSLWLGHIYICFPLVGEGITAEIIS
jgi:hypothetical protein